MSEVGHDREPETGAWLAFVEPLPALHALSQLDLAQTRPVVINDDGEAGGAVSLLGICRHSRLRPFAGIVEQVPDHLLEVLPLALEFEAGARLYDEIEPAFPIDAVERPLQRLKDLVEVGGVAE